MIDTTVGLTARAARNAMIFDEMPAAVELDIKWGPTWGDME